MKVKELNKVDNHELTPPYARYFVHLIRPFPDFDVFFEVPSSSKRFGQVPDVINGLGLFQR